MFLTSASLCNNQETSFYKTCQYPKSEAAESMSIPKNITREHIIKAINEIDKNGVPENRQQRKFNLKYNGKNYPPKYAISIANKYANGEELKALAFSGGDETNPFLKARGITIENMPAASL